MFQNTQFQNGRLKEPSNYPIKPKKLYFQRPKIQKETGLRGELNLSLTKEDFDSKFFQKNLAKINKKAEARKIYVTPTLLVSIESDRKKQIEELHKKVRDLKFQRIVENDKKTLHNKQMWSSRSIIYNRRLVRFVRNDVLPKKRVIKKKKVRFRLYAKKKKILVKKRLRFPGWWKKKKKKNVISTQQLIFPYISPEGVTFNLYKWELFRFYRNFLRKRSYRQLKEKPSDKHEKSVEKEEIKEYYGRPRNGLIMKFLRKSNKIGYLRYVSFKKKLFKGPRFRYVSKKDKKSSSFSFYYDSLRTDRKWIKQKFLFWAAFRFYFCVKSKQNLLMLKNRSKNFADFISLFESRLSSVLLRSVLPNSNIINFFVKAGLIFVGKYKIKNLNYILSPLDTVWFNISSFRSIPTNHTFLFLYRMRRWFNIIHRKEWEYAVYGTLKKHTFWSLSYIVESITKLALIFLKRPHFSEIPKLPFELSVPRFYLFAYKTV